MGKHWLLITVAAVFVLAGCKTTQGDIGSAPAPVVTPVQAAAPVAPVAPPAPPVVAPTPPPAVQPPPPQVAQPPSAPAPAVGGLSAADRTRAEALIEARCTQCHGAEVIRATNKQRDVWADTISRMVTSHGAVIPDAERVLLTNYLGETYGL